MNLTVSRRELLPVVGYLRGLRSCWFPLSLAVLFFGTTAYVGHAWGPTYFILSFSTFVIGLILLVDGLARLGTYLYYTRTDEILVSLRVLHYLRRSFCSRQVGIALCGDFARKFYRSQGYRWYHILPDETFTKRSPFFRLEFWRQVINPRV